MIKKFESRPALSPEQERAALDASWEIALKREAWGMSKTGPKLESEALLQELVEQTHLLELIWKLSTRSAESLLNHCSLESVVRGQLKTAISQHGPITANFVPSATKRVAGAVMGHLRQAALQDISNVAAKAEVERLRKEVADRDEKLRAKQVEIRGLLEKLGIPYNETKGPQ